MMRGGESQRGVLGMCHRGRWHVGKADGEGSRVVSQLRPARACLG